MTAPRPALSGRLVSGLAVVVLGLVSWALYGVQAGRENRSYDPNGAPPSTVRLVRGHTYWLAVPGGVPKLRAAGVEPSRLACAATPSGAAQLPLSVTGVVGQDGGDTKFTNRIASFAAPRSGRMQVTCTGVGRVYVENAADGGFDWSGFWLVLASAALVVGLPLTVSGLRRPVRPSLVGAGEDDEIE